MFVRQPPRAAVPSRGALHVLRQLALAGSTVGAVGSVCTITYEVHRRINIAERLVASKRELQSACPNYNAERGAATIARMVEAAEAGEFSGLQSMKERDKKSGRHKNDPIASRGQRSSTSKGASPTSLRPVNRRGKRFYSGLSSAQNLSDTAPPSESTLSSENGHSKLPIEPDYTPKYNEVPPRTPSTPSLAKFRLKYHDVETNSDNVQIHRLLSQGNHIAAADKFLDIYAKPSEHVSKNQRELAVTLFYSNIEDGNVFLAKNLFSWLDRFDRVTPALWELLLSTLAQTEKYGTMADVYTRFAGTFDIPPNILAPILTALLNTYRLSDAKTLIFQNLRHDENCGLCGIYLDGLWKKSRDIHLLEKQFRNLKLEAEQLGKKLTQRIFDPLLKAYTELGREEQATALVSMMEDYKIPLYKRTLGILAYGKALNCDWVGADTYLRRIYERRGKSKSKFTKVLNQAFDRVFLEYWLCHTGEEIYEYVFHAFKDYELVPDQVLFDHIVKALVQKGTPEMLGALLQFSEDHSWGVNLNQEYFMEVLREHQLSSEMSPAGLWRMFRATEHKFGYAAASRRILGFDRASFPHDESRKMPWSHEDTTWYRQALSMREPPQFLDHYATLHRHMFHCLCAGKFGVVLSLYHTAKQSAKVMKRIHLELAIIANVMLYGCTSEAKILLEGERDFKFGRPASSQLFQTVLQADTMAGLDAYRFALLSFYLVREQRLLPVTHSLLVGTSMKLILRGEPQTAAELFRVVNQSKYGAMTPFDIPALKMLVRAFANAGNRKGIRWALISSLKRKSARDPNLLVEYYRTVGRLQSTESEPEISEQLELGASRLEELVAAIDARLRYDTKLAQDKRTGVEAARIKDYYYAGEQSESASTTEISGKKVFEEKHLKATLAKLGTWDERAELEKVFADDVADDGGTDSLDHWREDRVLAEASGEEP